MIATNITYNIYLFYYYYSIKKNRINRREYNQKSNKKYQNQAITVHYCLYQCAMPKGCFGLLILRYPDGLVSFRVCYVLKVMISA